MGMSYPEGKSEIVQLLCNLSSRNHLLDVGCGDGIWSDLLKSHFSILDGVEICAYNVERFNLISKYNTLYVQDVRTFTPEKHYDVILLMDVIEHLSVEDAQKVINVLLQYSLLLVAAVPFHYAQGALYGNEAEIHLQDDLTNEIFLERYPLFAPFKLYGEKYGYYIATL